jgi:hypothetical protein
MILVYPSQRETEIVHQQAYGNINVDLSKDKRIRARGQKPGINQRHLNHHLHPGHTNLQIKVTLQRECRPKFRPTKPTFRGSNKMLLPLHHRQENFKEVIPPMRPQWTSSTTYEGQQGRANQFNV